MTTLVTWLWQGLAIAAVTSLLVRALPRLNATTRHAIWWLALAMVTLHPWARAALPLDASAAHASRQLDAQAVGAALVLPAPPEWLTVAVAGVWGSVVLFNLYRMAIGIRAIERLKRGSRRLGESHQQRLPLWLSIRGSGRRAELCVSDTATSPCALGFGRPVILIPAVLASTLPDHDLDLIVTHEHAHLARYDDWLRVLQCALVSCVGVHPAVRLIARQIDLEREAACDDRVVLRTGDPRPYARCLAMVAELTAGVSSAAAAVAPHAVRSTTALRARVVRLLDQRSDRTARLVRSGATVSLAAMTLAVFASDRIPPLVVVAVGTDARHDRRNDVPSQSRDEVRSGRSILSAGTTAASHHVDVAVVEARVGVIERQLPLSPPRTDDIRSRQLPLHNVQVPAPDVARDPTAAVPIDGRVPQPVLDASSFGGLIGSVGAPVVTPDAPDDRVSDWAVTLADGGVSAGQDAKRVGLSVGASSRRAGVSVGRFFGRAAKSVATSF